MERFVNFYWSISNTFKWLVWSRSDCQPLSELVGFWDQLTCWLQKHSCFSLLLPHLFQTVAVATYGSHTHSTTACTALCFMILTSAWQSASTTVRCVAQLFWGRRISWNMQLRCTMAKVLTSASTAKRLVWCIYIMLVTTSVVRMFSVLLYEDYIVHACCFRISYCHS